MQTMMKFDDDDMPETVFAAPPRIETEAAQARERRARRLWAAVAVALATWVAFLLWQVLTTR